MTSSLSRRGLAFLQAPNKIQVLRHRLRRPAEFLTSSGDLQPFIFTELYRCAKIGRVALDSLVMHHPDLAIHIFGTPADFAGIATRPQFILHDISRETRILENFNHGHLGTASLWAKIILERPERYIIHFDTDVIFRAPVFPDIINKLHAGYSQVGPRRNYQHNPNHRENVRWLADVSQTVCFGFDREKITRRSYPVLTKMCQGTWNPFGHPVIDFFDPVSFDIQRNGGQTFFLSPDDFGGCDAYGKRRNKYPAQNALIDFGDKLIHFAGVGSGMNFYEHQSDIASSVAQSYIDFAKEKYAIFCRLFYHETIDVPYDPKKYESLLAVADWYHA